MTRRLLPLVICAFLVGSCTNHREEPRGVAEQFHIDVMLRTTPVKDQGGDDLCWIYAMLATIETEHLMQGDSVDLSAAFMARQLLAEQARQCYVHGPQYKFSLRGMSTMALRLLQCYGVMPFSSYRMPGDADLTGLAIQVRRSALHARAHLTGLEHLDRQIGKTLDEGIGYLPSWVFMLGCQYTPLEFAHSICAKDEYLPLTSFTHHPFGQSFVLEVPDNHHHDVFLNLPIDSLMRYVDHALRTGHPVCWEGDVTEPDCDFRRGIARLPRGHKPVTQQSRQQAFDHAQTTDDHCMAVVGIAHDKDGKQFYICKNSWGKNTPYGGFFFMEEDYMRAKTIALIIPTTALPTMQQMTEGM